MKSDESPSSLLEICSHGSRHYNNELVAMLFLSRVKSSSPAKTFLLVASEDFFLD